MCVYVCVCVCVGGDLTQQVRGEEESCCGHRVADGVGARAGPPDDWF